MVLLSRILIWVLGLAIGAFVGAASTISHSFAIGGIPVGFLLAVLATAGLLLGIRLLAQDPWATLATGIGVFTAVVVLSGKGPGGSVVVAADAWGTAWSIAAGAIILLVVAWPNMARIRRLAAVPAPAVEEQPKIGE